MKRRVLIVDDIEFNIEFQMKIIDTIIQDKDVNIHVDTAKSIEDALSYIKIHTYDAMIIDIQLPDGSGIDIVTASREKNGKTKVAALTIYPAEYDEQKEYFDLFLKKPIIMDSYKRNFIELLSL